MSTNAITPTTEREDSPILGRWARIGLWLLPVYGALTLWATRTHQPNYRVDFAAYAEYISRPAFLPEHLVGSIGGTVLAMLGVTALFATLVARGARRLALAGLVSSIAGNALILTLFGVAAFVSPAVGRAYLDGQTGVVALNDDIYGLPLALTGATGTLLYSVGAVLLAIAIRRSGAFARWTAPAFASAAILIGPVGLFVGVAQTVGSILLITSTLSIARSARRRPVSDGDGHRSPSIGRSINDAVSR